MNAREIQRCRVGNQNRKRQRDEIDRLRGKIDMLYFIIGVLTTVFIVVIGAIILYLS